MIPTDHSRRAIIDLHALSHNLRVLKEAAPRAAQMAVVKANAYGHGMQRVALAALEAGADWLGVAQTDEALELRSALTEAGIGASQAPILAWISQNDAHWADLIAAHIDLSVSSVGILHEICQASSNLGIPARIHLEIDTGMSRGGITVDGIGQLADALREASDLGHVRVIGAWTHLARADDLSPEGLSATADQISLYEQGLAFLEEHNIRPQLRHMCATSGVLWHPEAHYDMVRIGIGMYGLSPDPSVATSKELGLLPVMTLETSMELVKGISQDTPVSYGGTYRTPTPRWIGLVAMGYADGIPRAASNRGQVLVMHGQQGLLCTVVGRICMDQLMVDLGPARDSTDLDSSDSTSDTGDRRITGTSKGEPSIPLADAWAEASNTINYEIVTRVGQHVPRVYVSKEQN